MDDDELPKQLFHSFLPPKRVQTDPTKPMPAQHAVGISRTRGRRYAKVQLGEGTKLVSGRPVGRAQKHHGQRIQDLLVEVAKAQGTRGNKMRRRKRQCEDPPWLPNAGDPDGLLLNREWDNAANWLSCAQDPTLWGKYVRKYLD